MRETLWELVIVMDDDGTPDSWDAIDDSSPDNNENLSAGVQSLNVNARPFIPNVNAPVFVPSFAQKINTSGKRIFTLLQLYFNAKNRYNST